jgi:cellobiose-specific phosphotransferase system component IIA
MTISTAGDARRLILETIAELKAGTMDASRGMAIAANMKVLNDSVFAEVAVAKVAMQAKDRGHDFGRVVQMGQQKLGA